MSRRLDFLVDLGKITGEQNVDLVIRLLLGLKELLQSARKVINLELDSDKKRLLENFLSLSLLQGANYVLPLITLPYLVRVLGPEKFGLVAFAQAFVQYFNILTDYGFNLSATREISIHRENKEKISEIFSSVMIIKFALLILSFIIMTVIVFSFEKFKRDWLVYYLTFGTVVGQVLFPVWFFQGMEKMKYISFIEIVIKLFFLFCIFFLVHSTSDYWKVLLLSSVAMILGGSISMMIIFKKFKVYFYFPNLKSLFYFLKNATPLFFSQVSVSFFNQANTFIGGLIFNYTLIGYYNAAEKLFSAFRNVFGIIFRTLYPRFSKMKTKFTSSYIQLVIIISGLISFSLYFSASKIVGFLFGKEYQITISILEILSLALFFSGINIMVFTLWFLSNGLNKHYFLVTTFAGVFNVAVLLILSKLYFLGILSIPVSLVLTEVFLMITYVLTKKFLYIRCFL